MGNLESEEPLRKVGLYSYDSPAHYHLLERVKLIRSLGLVQECNYLKEHTTKPIKGTYPGPLTITIHMRLQGKNLYKDWVELAYEFALT